MLEVNKSVPQTVNSLTISILLSIFLQLSAADVAKCFKIQDLFIGFVSRYNNISSIRQIKDMKQET